MADNGDKGLVNTDIGKLDDVTKFSLFDKHLRNLFAVCRNSIEQTNARKVVKSKNIVNDSFENFEKMYEEIGPEDTIVLFEELYSNKRFQILSGESNWIKNKCIIEYPRAKKSKRRRSIMLSILYRDADKLSEDALEEIEKFDKRDNEANVFLPDGMILPILEIFTLVCKAEDRAKIQSLVNDVKEELKDEDVTTSRPATGATGMGGLGDILQKTLGGLDVSKLQQSFEQMQQQAAKENGGEGGSSPNMSMPDNLGDMISDVLSNPKSKDVINKVTNSFKGAKDINGMVGAVSGLMADTELHETVKELVPKPQPISDNETNRMIEEAKVRYPSQESTDDVATDDLSGPSEKPRDPYECEDGTSLEHMVGSNAQEKYLENKNKKEVSFKDTDTSV
jgi:hypothetical protein